MDQKNSESLIEWDEKSQEWRVSSCTEDEGCFASVEMYDAKTVMIGCQIDHAESVYVCFDKASAQVYCNKLQELINQLRD